LKERETAFAAFKETDPSPQDLAFLCELRACQAEALAKAGPLRLDDLYGNEKRSLMAPFPRNVVV
jgi:hypothetical protein